MILEHARIEIKPGTEEQFLKAVQLASRALNRAVGCHGIELYKSVEAPNRFHILTKWDTVENHTVDFRNSTDPDAKQWRELARPCFAAPSLIDHIELVPLKG